MKCIHCMGYGKYADPPHGTCPECKGSGDMSPDQEKAYLDRIEKEFHNFNKRN